MTTSHGRFYIVSDSTLNEANDLLETIANLNYLTCADARNPAAVERWTLQSEGAIKRLGVLIRNIVAD